MRANWPGARRSQPVARLASSAVCTPGYAQQRAVRLPVSTRCNVDCDIAALDSRSRCDNPASSRAVRTRAPTATVAGPGPPGRGGAVRRLRHSAHTGCSGHAFRYFVRGIPALCQIMRTIVPKKFHEAGIRRNNHAVAAPRSVRPVRRGKGAACAPTARFMPFCPVIRIDRLRRIGALRRIRRRFRILFFLMARMFRIPDGTGGSGEGGGRGGLRGCGANRSRTSLA
jgi:hypothetical protein